MNLTSTTTTTNTIIVNTIIVTPVEPVYDYVSRIRRTRLMVSNNTLQTMLNEQGYFRISVTYNRIREIWEEAVHYCNENFGQPNYIWFRVVGDIFNFYFTKKDDAIMFALKYQ